MEPGLSEREFRALETIRRDWLDRELTSRYPELTRRQPAGGSWLARARMLPHRLTERCPAPTSATAPQVPRHPVEAALRVGVVSAVRPGSPSSAAAPEPRWPQSASGLRMGWRFADPAAGDRKPVST